LVLPQYNGFSWDLRIHLVQYLLIKRDTQDCQLILHQHLSQVSGTLQISGQSNLTENVRVDRWERWTDVVAYLIEKGADVNLCSDEKENPRTPLHAAGGAWRYSNAILDPEIVKMLLDHGANVNAIDQHQRTPLHYAAMAGNEDIIRMFLKAGARYDLKDKFGQSPSRLISSGKEKELLPLFEEKKQ
jgi:ankyrin repeat protein